MTGTYSVKAYGPIARRETNSVRRRAGIAFGREETLVTTDPGVEGATLVTEEQLDLILGDSCLTCKEMLVVKAPPPGEGDSGPAPQTVVPKGRRTR